MNSSGAMLQQALEEHSISKELTEYSSPARESLRSGLRWLWESKLFLDTLLVVGDSYETGHKIKVHGVVLAACSDPFKAMLSCGFSETEERRILIPNHAPEIVQSMIDFLYTSEICIGDDQVVDLFTLADQYGVLELKRMCEQHVSSSISIDSVIPLLISANHRAASQLQTKCLSFFKDHAQTLLASESMNTLPEELLIAILQLDFRAPEIDVFRCVMRWGAAHVDQSTPNGFKSEQERRERQATAVRGPIRFVRFACIRKDVLKAEVLPLQVLPNEIMFDVLFQRIKDPFVQATAVTLDGDAQEVDPSSLYEVKPWLKPRGRKFKTMEDFPNEEAYGRYLKSILRPGMLLRAVHTYENVQQHDIGEFIQFNAGIPPCQVQWHNYGNTYWLYWRDLEVIDE